MNTLSAERTVCSSILYDIKLANFVYGTLLPEHFFDDGCKDIYSLLIDSYITKKSITDDLIIAKLPDRVEDLVNIVAVTPVMGETLQLLSDNIIGAYENRNMLKHLDTIKSAILEGRDYSLDDLKRNSFTSVSLIRDNEEILARMEDRINNPIKDYGTGLSEVDRYLNLEPGNLIVVAARPSMGKTALILTIILHLLKNNEGSLFFSLEMPSEAIMMRALSNASGETLSDIRHNKIVNYASYQETRNKLSITKDFLMIDDAVDHIQIYNIGISSVKKNPAIKNIFIDHLTYIKDPGGFQNTHSRIGEVTKTMKRLAKDAGVKVWLLSQLSRSIESRPNRRPQLSDMRESGSIEEDADVILGIYRDSYYVCREEAKREDPVNEVEIIVLKNRDGEVGGAKTMFIGPKVKFTDKVDRYVNAAEVTDYEYDDAEVIPSISYDEQNLNMSMPEI